MLKHISTTINTTVCSRVLLEVFLAVLLAVFSLTACSGGGGFSTTDTTTTSPPTTLTTYTITASTGSGGTVTPSGATTVTQGASQSYTITPNANYAIATLVIDGTTVATSATHTFTNVQTNHTISATFIAAAPGGIVLSLVPARTSGVAPLAVFFDASATTDIGVTNRPFHDLEYTWSFGDPGSGTWASGAQPGVSSKNSATGPVAAHVFETPGTYTVTLTAFDGTNTATTNTTITVEDPDTAFAGSNTICFSTSGNFTGCPAGATQTTSSDFVTAIANQATSKRLLFRRGETFTAASAAAITVTGPGIVGAFGAGAAPIVQMTGAQTANNAPILNLSSANTPDIKDWRIMDLEFDGLSKTNSVGIDTQGSIKQVLVLNMNMHDIKEGILFNGSMLEWHHTNGKPAHAMYDEMAVVDSTITPVVGLADGWRIFVAAQHLSIMGNELGDMVNAAGSGSHVVRTTYIGKGVIANNTIARSSVNLALKLHGPHWCHFDSPPGTCTFFAGTPPTTYNYIDNLHPIGPYAATSGYTEQVVISDNKFIGASSPYLVVMGPQNAQKEERVRDVIVERNWFQASNNLTLRAVAIHSYETTARNNICDMTGGETWVACFEPALYAGTNSPARPPDNIWIYNNTAYRGDSGSEFSFVKIDTTSTNVTVQNNLAYAPLSTSTMVVNGTGGGGLVQSNNSTNTQIKSTFPAWVSATPSSPADFSLTAGSYAREAGFAVPVWSDFFRTSRPQNGVIDIGAVEGH